MPVTLSPSEIRYSQDSISHKFRNGNLLTSTFAQLISGQLSVSSLEMLECFSKDGNWYAASGNRRLFLYKKLQEAGVLHTITVLESSSSGGWNFTTSCSGIYVRCRRSEVEDNLDEIISQWRSGENVVAKWGPPPASTVASRLTDLFDRLNLRNGYDYDFDSDY